MIQILSTIISSFKKKIIIFVVAIILFSCNAKARDEASTPESIADRVTKVTLTISDSKIIKDWTEYFSKNVDMDCNEYLTFSGAEVASRETYSESIVKVTMTVYGEWVGPSYPITELSGLCKDFSPNIRGEQFISKSMWYTKLGDIWTLKNIN